MLDVTTIPTAEFPRVMRSRRHRALVRQVTTMSTAYLGMNCELPPFDDVRVRRAINYAVDKKKLLRLINGRGVLARGILPPSMPGYQTGLQGYPHDPRRARKLLHEAGYGNGFSTTLWVQLDEDSLRLAQGVQQDLRAVGIGLTIRPLAWAPFLQKIRQRGEVPFFRLAWQADYPDPSNFLETLLHSGNRVANNHTFFSDTEFDGLLDSAAGRVDPEIRKGILQAAERRAVDAAPWVFLYHPLSYVIVHPRVRDLQLHPLRPLRFNRVWLGKESAGN
jgi:ABC-type transport system substrate-binding protein